eukprot:PITA_29236
MIQAISNCFGFAASSAWSSFKYLGLPVFQKRALNKDWLPLLEKIKSKICSWGYNWLNLAGKTVLIKAVLNSLPIYQAAVMMAPLGITRKIEEYIRFFFWKGGKANEKRIPLVSWDTISLPRMEGGLQFKNIYKQNIALGAKLLWRIIAPNPGWAQLVLWKKYFRGQRAYCLDNPITTSGTMIHKLRDRSSGLIKQHMHWIPRNGKRINIWEDRIMENNNWQSWGNLEVPAHLSKEYTNLLTHLKGKAPLNISKADARGWGSILGKYTVLQGYKQLTQYPNVPPDPRPWQGIWSHSTIPKIDIFCWLLCHHRILNEDRLRKRGVNGPSRCSLCEDHEEIATHLILSCKFAAALWKEASSPLNSDFTPPNHCSNLFANWMCMYPGGTQNPHIKTAWLALPKITCWHIWLERNQRIFNDKKSDPKITWIKIRCHLKDCVGDHLDREDLSNQGTSWGYSLGLQFVDKVRLPPPLKHWKIRLKTEELVELCKKKARKTLFFDGAAKGNPGSFGAGGVIKNADGRIESRYAWGVGFNSSIQAEALALLQGLKMLISLGIKDAIIFWDSQSIIKAMVDKSSPSDLRLSRLLSRIRVLTNTFQNLEFLHVKRENNKEADAEANKAVLLPPGALLRDGDEGWDPIP